MQVSLSTEAKVRHVALSVDCLFTVLPILGLIPATGAGVWVWVEVEEREEVFRVKYEF